MYCRKNSDEAEQDVENLELYVNTIRDATIHSRDDGRECEG